MTENSRNNIPPSGLLSDSYLSKKYARPSRDENEYVSVSPTAQSHCRGRNANARHEQGPKTVPRFHTAGADCNAGRAGRNPEGTHALDSPWRAASCTGLALQPRPVGNPPRDYWADWARVPPLDEDRRRKSLGVGQGRRVSLVMARGDGENRPRARRLT